MLPPGSFILKKQGDISERRKFQSLDIFLSVTSTVFESKDEPTQMTRQSFTIIDFITFRKSIHFKLICKKCSQLKTVFFQTLGYSSVTQN